MRVEIIATGSELLLGEQVDTNSAYMARRLREVGLLVKYKTVVGDDEAGMVESIQIALSRSDLILIGGGLGPTLDDVTRPAVARALGRELVFQQDLLDQIEARFRAYGRPMGENNRRQAYVPEGAQPILNPVGTAPAFLVEYEGRTLISLPGVPREMEYLFEHAVLPYLRSRLSAHQIVVVRTLHTVGEGESRLDALIADLQRSTNPVFGLSAKSGQVDVRMTQISATVDDALRTLAEMEARVRERIGAWIFGADDDTLESVIAARLAEHGQTLATVELNTGGLVSSRLTLPRAKGQSDHASSPAAFVGGLVLSDPAALSKTLSVEVDSGGYAAVVVRAAQRIRAIHSATFGLAVMLTTADDGSLRMYAGLAWEDGSETAERSYGGHAGLAAQFAASLGLGLVWRHVKETQ